MKNGVPAAYQVLRAAREKADLTQSELAEKAGCSQSAVSMFERGHPNMLAQEKVADIARVLGIDFKSLPSDAQAPAELTDLVMKYCPIDDCPTQEPYLVMERLCYRPRSVWASASERTHCAECGELMEKRCPNAKCYAPVEAGSFCRACGTPYVTAGIEGTEVTEEWLERRAERARALRVERENGSDEGRGPADAGPGRASVRKGRR